MPPTESLSPDEHRALDAYWRASNYLSVGQIYLLDNTLLRRPLTREDVKLRLLGHWGTTPGLNFIYVHLNRLITRHDLDVLSPTGAPTTRTSTCAATRRLGVRAAYAKQAIRDKLIEHRAYIRAHGDDLREIRSWRWSLA